MSFKENPFTGKEDYYAKKASEIKVNTTDFDNNLSAADDTVQKALNTLDDIYSPTAGADTQIIYNTLGTATGSNNLIWNYATNKLVVSGTTVTTGFQLVSSTGNSGYVLTTDANGVGTWQSNASGNVSGSGTTNVLSLWTGSTTLGDSAIDQDGSNVAVGNRNFKITNSFPQVFIDSTYSPTANTSSIDFRYGAGGVSTAWRVGSGVTKSEDNNFEIVEGLSANRMYFKPGGNIGIGTTAPSSALQIHVATGNDMPLMLSVGDITHTVTSIIPDSSVYGVFAAAAADTGGLQMVGISVTESNPGMTFMSIISTTATSAAPIQFTAYKADGAGSIQVLAASEQAFNFGGSGSGAVSIYGDSETVWNNVNNNYVTISPNFTEFLMSSTGATGILFARPTDGVNFAQLCRADVAGTGIVNFLTLMNKAGDTGSIIDLVNESGYDLIAMDSFGGLGEFSIAEGNTAPSASTYFVTQDQAGKDIRYALPSTTGAVGQILTIDSFDSGVALLEWATGGSVTGSSGNISGTIASTQIAFGTAADTIGGNANFTYNSTNKALTLTTDQTNICALNVLKAAPDATPIMVARFDVDGSSTGTTLGIQVGNGTLMFEYPNSKLLWGIIGGDASLGLTSTSIDVIGILTTTGNVGIGTTAPTASLHLRAGTTAASTAPLKFIAGTNMTNAEAGAMEWNGTNLFISQTSGPTRKTFAFLESPSFTTPNIGAATGTSLSVTGDIKNSTAGGGIYIKEGTNATMGVTTLASGTATVSTTKITANSRIFLTVQGGTLTNVGSTYISSTSAGSGFNISSTNILDASTVAWLIMESS